MLQQYAEYAFKSNIEKNPSVLGIDQIPKCYGHECITVGIAYTSAAKTDLTDYVIKHISLHQNLKIGTDIQEIANNYNDLLDYVTENTNKTQTIILFCTGEFELPENPLYNGTFNCLRDTGPVRLGLYSLLINSTITPLVFFSGFTAALPVDYASLSVKLAVDSALYAYYSNSSLESKSLLSIEVQNYPMPPNRFLDGFDIVSKVGVFYFFIPPMVTFVVILIEIVREKEYKLRHGLCMMGMTSGPY